MKLIKPQHRKEVSCSCHACKSMCQRSPCFPTPEEVEKLIAAGHRGKLMGTLFIDIDNFRSYDVVAPEKTPNGCAFLNEKGLCSLHKTGMKPLEGRLAIHDTPDNGLRVWVAAKWDTPKGREVMANF